VDLEIVLACDDPRGIDAVHLDDCGENIERRIRCDIVNGHPQRDLVDEQASGSLFNVTGVMASDERSKTLRNRT
jgi:hypothetical protein